MDDEKYNVPVVFDACTIRCFHTPKPKPCKRIMTESVVYLHLHVPTKKQKHKNDIVKEITQIEREKLKDWEKSKT